MGLKVTGIDATARRLESQGGRTNKTAIQEMMTGAELIQELAKLKAPVDKHNLEDAIRMSANIANPLNAHIEVYVDENMGVAGRPDKKVGDYATRMHEGFYKLGKKSAAKQSANPSIKVGRKFLEDAAEELEKEIASAVEAAIINSL